MNPHKLTTMTVAKEMRTTMMMSGLVLSMMDVGMMIPMSPPRETVGSRGGRLAPRILAATSLFKT